MANEVATTNPFGNAVAVKDVKALAQRAQAAAQNTPRGNAPGGSDYMNYSGKLGKFTIGQDKRVISPDELWVVDVASFEEGFVAWKASRPAGKRMANIYTGVPVQQPDDNEGGPFNFDKGEGWHQAKAMVLRSTEFEQQGYLTINSVSGVDAMAQLIGHFAERAATDEPCWPVVSLDSEQFTAQGHVNFKPVFKEIAWLTDAQLQQIAEGVDIGEIIDLPEPEKKPEPAARRRRTV